MGDPELAAMMRRVWKRPPVERIVRTEHLATALNRDKLGKNLANRIVLLECGHMQVTRNAKTAPCTQCHKMILAGEDYDAFRNRRQ